MPSRASGAGRVLVRSCRVLVVRVVLVLVSSGGGTRTRDTTIMSRVL